MTQDLEQQSKDELDRALKKLKESRYEFIKISDKFDNARRDSEDRVIDHAKFF